MKTPATHTTASGRVSLVMSKSRVCTKHLIRSRLVVVLVANIAREVRHVLCGFLVVRRLRCLRAALAFDVVVLKCHTLFSEDRGSMNRQGRRDSSRLPAEYKHGAARSAITALMTGSPTCVAPWCCQHSGEGSSSSGPHHGSGGRTPHRRRRQRCRLHVQAAKLFW
jgi:hypothetical protein